MGRGEGSGRLPRLLGFGAFRKMRLVVSKELVVSRDTLEIGAQYSVLVRDIPAFERSELLHWTSLDNICKKLNRLKSIGRMEG